jgi:sigma54-dependent transcription regulator
VFPTCLNLQVRNSEDEYAMLMAAVERGNFAVSGREQTVDSLKKEIAVNQVEAEQILAEKVCNADYFC